MNKDHNNRAFLIKKIKSEHTLLEKSLATLNPDDWLTPGVVGNWTAKDLLAHLTAWEGFLRDWYQSGLRNETPAIPAPGYSGKLIDQLNEHIFSKNLDRPPEVIYSEFQTSYLETLSLVESIPEEDIFAAGQFAWTGKINLHAYIAANTYNHYRWARSKLCIWKQS